MALSRAYVGQARQAGEGAIELTYQDELRDLPVEQFALGETYALIIANTLEVLPCCEIWAGGE